MVLGSMLTSVNSLNVASDSLDSSDFYYTEHQIVFDVLKAAYKNDKPADVHLVCEELKRQGKLKSIGGAAYITSLAQYAGTSAFIEEYAEVVRSKAILRRMIRTAHDIERNAAADPSDVHALLDDAQQKLFVISQATRSQGGVLIRDILSGVKASAKIPFLKELQQKQEEFKLKGPEDPGITGLPSHFIDLDKMINGLGKSNFILLAARPAMGKCVAGDTKIIDPTTGSFRSIKDLVKEGKGHIATLGKDWTLKKQAPSHFVADGIKPTFRLKTALGKEIEATAVHPFLTMGGWKRLEELRAGDRIATPRKLPYFGKKTWDEHKLIALGYFIADGCLTHSSPSFTNTNSKIVADFKSAIASFDNEESLHGFVCSWAHATAMPSASMNIALQEEFPEPPSFSLTVRTNPVSEWLKELGLMGKNSHEKDLPEEVFELTKENVSILISRLFSCDGTAYVANCQGQPFAVIAYTSVSKSLICQIQHLLLRFGILSKIVSKKTTCNGKIFPSFELEIHGKENLTRFCEEIGIFGKEEAVSKVLTHVSSTPMGWTKDTLPIEIRDLILAKKGSRSWGSLFENGRKRLPLRDTPAKPAYVPDDPELKQIARSDVYWDEITSIEPTGEKEVFDLTVDETHNFVAADIIVHNTAFAVNIAENLCFKSGIPVGIFSLEMTAEQLLHRLICSQAEIESEKLRTGNLNGADFQRIVGAVNSMQKSTMVIDDQPGLKITDLRARARRMKETHGIQFLVIDYLQLISGSGNSKSAENRQNEISEISRMLKNLARELNIPIVCLSQLSRKVEERPGHRPMMSDLRESGCLAQDTLIQDANTGRFYTIKELAERTKQDPIFVHAVDKDLKFGKHRMTKAFYSGKKMLYELKTRTGRTIKASSNHPFLQLKGWTALEDLKTGDRIGLAGGSDLRWEEILSIKELQIDDVYDATVENVHNFVANDLIVHNSLEQDSDVVIFLLRREYYDPYDKPGMAEVIVAKNRHGGVGSVFLTFRKELAQFANYSASLDKDPSGGRKEDAFSAFIPQ